MRRLTRRQARTVRELARLLAALDAQAATARPGRRKIFRTSLGPVR